MIITKSFFQCSNLFQTSAVGRQLAPDVLVPNFFLHRALDFVTSLLALEWIQSPGQKALLCALLPHYQIKIISDFKKFFTTQTMLSECRGRVAEVAREHGWHPPKSLDSDEYFKPKHTLFCRKLRFVAIYTLFF